MILSIFLALCESNPLSYLSIILVFILLKKSPPEIVIEFLEFGTKNFVVKNDFRYLSDA